MTLMQLSDCNGRLYLLYLLWSSCTCCCFKSLEESPTTLGLPQTVNNNTYPFMALCAKIKCKLTCQILAKPFLYAMLSSKCLTCINSFILKVAVMIPGQLLSPLHKWGDWNTERTTDWSQGLINLMCNKLLGNTRVRILTKATWLERPRALS